MKPEEFEKLELEKLYGELRDKMNTRLPTWSLLITLFGAFSYASVQQGMAGYIVLCYPLLAYCVARFVGITAPETSLGPARAWRVVPRKSRASPFGDGASSAQFASDAPRICWLIR